MVPSFVEHLDHPTEVEGLGTIMADIAYGGVYFAMVDAPSLGFSITPDEAREMVDTGIRISAAALEQVQVRHPEVPSINKVEYTMYCGREPGSEGAFKNGTVIFPGRMDRSPCGTGTSARLAVMHARGELAPGQQVTHKSIIGSEFRAEILKLTSVGDKPAVLNRISGRAWIYALTQFGVDPSDPYPLGYTLSDTWGPGFGTTP